MEYSSSTGCSSCSGGSAGLISKIVYPTFTREFRYDNRGRKTAEIDLLSETEQYIANFDYDNAGNLISRTDKEGKTTAYEYDELKRLVTVTDPAGGITRYTYDDRDNLITLTDAENHTTGFVG